jgi:hypothetical protein
LEACRVKRAVAIRRARDDVAFVLMRMEIGKSRPRLTIICVEQGANRRGACRQYGGDSSMFDNEIYSLHTFTIRHARCVTC